MKTANRLFFIAKLLTYILYKLQYIELFNVIILPQRHTHSIKFCLISLCLIISNHHLPCPFPLLGTDRRWLTAADHKTFHGDVLSRLSNARMTSGDLIK